MGCVDDSPSGGAWRDVRDEERECACVRVVERGPR